MAKNTKASKGQDSIQKRAFIVAVIILTTIYYLRLFTQDSETMLLVYVLLVLLSPLILALLIYRIFKNNRK